MADMERIASDTLPLVLFSGNYKKRNASGAAIIEKIRCFYFPAGLSSLFGEHLKDASVLIDEYRNYITGALADYSGYAYNPDEWAFNDHAADGAWKADKKVFTKRYNVLFGDDIAWIQPRPKRDHKAQRRLQCAIPGRFLGRLYDEYGLCEIASNKFDEPETWTVLVSLIENALS